MKSPIGREENSAIAWHETCQEEIAMISFVYSIKIVKNHRTGVVTDPSSGSGGRQKEVWVGHGSVKDPSSGSEGRQQEVLVGHGSVTDPFPQAQKEDSRKCWWAMAQ